MKHLYTAFQGFLGGAIVMAIVTGYNKDQIPFAIIALFMSIVTRWCSE